MNVQCKNKDCQNHNKLVVFPKTIIKFVKGELKYFDRDGIEIKKCNLCNEDFIVIEDKFTGMCTNFKGLSTQEPDLDILDDDRPDYERDMDWL